jgi:hypothetical protein
MNPSHKRALEAAHALLRSGYAADLISDILAGDTSETDADSLFRTLVLDEGWSEGVDARDLFNIARQAIIGSEYDNELANRAHARWVKS